MWFNNLLGSHRSAFCCWTTFLRYGPHASPCDVSQVPALCLSLSLSACLYAYACACVWSDLLGWRRSVSCCFVPPLEPLCQPMPLPGPPGPSCIALSSTCSRLVILKREGSTMFDLGGRLTAVQPASSTTPAEGGPPPDLPPPPSYTDRQTHVICYTGQRWSMTRPTSTEPPTNTHAGTSTQCWG